MDKRKKVGILTYHYSNNYGAVLQTYSLQLLLKKHGFNVFIINLVPNHGIKGKVKDILVKPLSKTFQEFKNSELKLYPEKPIFYNELKEVDFSIFHALIVGSDQVWRKDYTEGLGYSYFLDFVPPHVKKISYAASFGLDYYQGNAGDVKTVSESLKNFDLITLREASGVDICEKLFKVKGHLVLDPVMLSLVEDYNFSNNNSHSNFITQYLLDVTPKKTALVKHIAKELKSNIVYNYKQNTKTLSVKNVLFNRKKELFPEISFWTYNLKNANLIITDSFHGVAFSILFNKNFICIFNEKRGKTRMQNLLNIFNLSHRAFSDSEIDSITIKQLKPINYKEVNTILKERKQFAINLLLNSLSS